MILFSKLVFNKHWHTHRDNMDNICKKTLNAVGQTLLKSNLQRIKPAF